MKSAIKVKIEIDTTPSLGFRTEEKLSIKSFSLYVKCFTLQDLFAGKMHALLFRKWKGRVKGRDWFNMERYIRKGIPLNLQHLLIRSQGSGDWKEKSMTKEQLWQCCKIEFSRFLLVAFGKRLFVLFRMISWLRYGLLNILVTWFKKWSSCKLKSIFNGRHPANWTGNNCN